MIETGQPLQHGPFEDHAENTDRNGRDDQRRPISDVEHAEQEIRAERAHHVERAMREIDDVEHAEDHGESKTEQRVERAVDQSHQKLRVESLHRSIFRNSKSNDNTETGPAGATPTGHRVYFFNSAHLLSDSGVNAWSPGTVPTSL